MGKRFARVVVLAMSVSLSAAACGAGTAEDASSGSDVTAVSGSVELREPLVPSESESSPTPVESPINEMLGIPLGNEDELAAFYEELARGAERKIAECMLREGFEYTPIDFVDRGEVDGLTDPDSKEFIEEYGFGVASNPFGDMIERIEAFEDPNQAYLESLSDGEAEAYMHALRSDLFESATPLAGGCESEAYEEAFAFGTVFEQFGDELEEMRAAVDADPRIVAARAGWGECMSGAGYNYRDAEDARRDFERQLSAITSKPGAIASDGTQAPIEVEFDGPRSEGVFTVVSTLSPEAQAEVDKLAVEEVAVALTGWECEAPLREIQGSVYVKYEQQFVDQYGDQVKAALGE